jgi:hypothetical protein
MSPIVKGPGTFTIPPARRPSELPLFGTFAESATASWQKYQQKPM